MISVEEVITDPDMIAPRNYTILRSQGQFVAGGFQSTVTPIPMFGPVQQASNKEIDMIPEADRVGAMRSFWSTCPLYVTRGQAPVPGTHGEVPTGSGTNYTLTSAPPDGLANVYVDGLQLLPTAYTIAGTTLTLNATPTVSIYVTWSITVMVGQSASDILQYKDEQYRVLQVYRDDGGGYWKAVATRMAAS